jgi:hypothetical protein
MSASSNPTPPLPSRAHPWHWVLLVLGVLLTVLGLGLSGGGVTLLIGDAAQQEGRYVFSRSEELRTPGHALTSEAIVVDPAAAGGPSLPRLQELASVQVQVTPVVPGDEIFVGIGPEAEVSAYLRDVAVTRLGDLPRAGKGTDDDWWPDDQVAPTTSGDRTPDPPGEQDFWAGTASGGPGAQELTIDLQPGEWTLVVMNADADRPVWVDLQAGARTELLGPIGSGVLVLGLIGVVAGVPLLLWGTAGLDRNLSRDRRPGSAPGAVLAADHGGGSARAQVYPLRLTGVLDQPLSRGLWLVKWLLAIPHAIVLAVLWIALAVTTIAAGFAILFTGRYPRSWFFFSVGVLRWSWRVGFYGYSALGTDRYPPFSLAPVPGYPADLEVEYPARLSRGLVLVKWWLLVIPHLLIVGIITAGAGAARGYDWDGGPRMDGGSWSPPLLGLLVLVAAVVLLFTGRYHDALFDLVMGLNRWVYRVNAYVLLLRDEYPPFRLDQGPAEPSGRTVPPGPAPPGTAPRAPVPVPRSPAEP